MAKPVLSIGMIIKNEIRCLERCLKSLIPLRNTISCELVIADTGSTDGSREMAERYADILFDFPWINDFAVARNAVLDRCSGSWYMTIDADEWLEDDYRNIVSFLESADQKKYDCVSSIQRNYLSADFLDYTDSFVSRIARMDGKNLRYVGAIHETLIYANGKKPRLCVRPDIIQYHDGYLNVDPVAKQEKNHRNMVLLRKEYEKNPKDLRRILQCLQSAENIEEKMKFVKIALDRIHELSEEKDLHIPALYRECLHGLFITGNNDALYECLKEGLQRTPESFLLRVDGNAFAALASYEEKNYNNVCSYAKKYQEALKGVENSEDLKQLERYASQYSTNNIRWKNQISFAMFHSCLEIGDSSGAEAAIKEINYKLLSEEALREGIQKLLLWGKPPIVGETLRKIWKSAIAAYEAASTDREKKEEYDRVAAIVLGIWDALPENIDFLAQEMENDLPGQCARILMSVDKAEVDAVLRDIVDLKWVFPEVYLRVMELRLPLPDKFYQQQGEELVKISKFGNRYEPMYIARVVADWLLNTPAPETLVELLWVVTLLENALQADSWVREEKLAGILVDSYQKFSSQYLKIIYNPTVLCEENIRALPAIRRFDWRLYKAREALEQGNNLEYVRQLKLGLKYVPELYSMVEFLLQRLPQPAPSPELLNLAGQVKAALAQYAPDDPAVLQLKATPVYQSVASLLEDGTSIPAKESPDPVLEDAIRALEKDCTFSTPTQAAIALQASYQGVHPDNQKSLADYWAKYPLWGETPDQVFTAAGKAFADHHDDLFWLFGRLADNQSRRVLLAVLSNWRFYDAWKLNAVKETKYDDYFDLDLLHCDDNEVVADLGAYIGDTFLSYVKNYGSLAYKRYYCYEITSDSFAQLAQVTKPYPRVILRRKGAGDGPGTMTLSTGSDASANTLTVADDAPQPETTEQEITGETVDIVALDDDITEPLTLIKMDIEGAEQSALRGCARHIREDHPKLALSVYHNFEDIWKLPRMIEELVPGYRFYLRYHGGNLWATEISLLALPPERK